MKTDIDIKDDLYRYLSGSAIMEEVTGSLSKTLRPDTSEAEDVVISILGNVNSDIQQAYVNVNIYVADIKRGNQYEENSIRLRQLCNASKELLGVGSGEGYRFTLEEQRVMEVQGRNEHFINNKLLYKYSKY